VSAGRDDVVVAVSIVIGFVEEPADAPGIEGFP